MNIEIAAIDQASYETWDNFVSASANGTLFHKSYWLKASGRPFDLWGAYQSGNLVAGYVASRKSLLGRPVITAPFLTPYSGLILQKPGGGHIRQVSFLQEVERSFAEFLPGKYPWGISLFPPGTDSVLPFIWAHFAVRPWFTYLIDISDLDKVWDGIHNHRRQDIKKARAAGVEIVSDVPFEKVMGIVNRSFERQGLTFRIDGARPYFEELTKRNCCRPFVAVDQSGKELAAIYGIWDERRLYCILMGFNDGSDYRGAVSPLCWWEMIRFASEELGLKEMDLEGTELPRIEAYYRSFGGRLVPYYEVRWGKAIGALVGLNRFLGRCRGRS